MMGQYIAKENALLWFLLACPQANRLLGKVAHFKTVHKGPSNFNSNTHHKMYVMLCSFCPLLFMLPVKRQCCKLLSKLLQHINLHSLQLHIWYTGVHFCNNVYFMDMLLIPQMRWTSVKKYRSMYWCWRNKVPLFLRKSDRPVQTEVLYAHCLKMCLSWHCRQILSTMHMSFLSANQKSAVNFYFTHYKMSM